MAPLWVNRDIVCLRHGIEIARRFFRLHKGFVFSLCPVAGRVRPCRPPSKSSSAYRQEAGPRLPRQGIHA